MLDTVRPRTIAEMPAQVPHSPATSAEARGRFFNTGNAFNVKLPIVPDHIFVDEAVRALDPATPTGMIDCDLSQELACAFPATTPLVLARYARIRAGETLEAALVASGIICYVIAGSGTTTHGDETLSWREGDIFVLPGGAASAHAADADAVLWIVTNEPQLAFENLQAPKQGNAPTQVVHFTGAEIARQIEHIHAIGRTEEIPGSALIFSSEQQEGTRNILPTLTLAMNSLQPGQSQRPHRHNAIAISLVIQGKDCHSVMNGKRKDWAPWATTVTPPVSVHSHHNEGSEQAMFLIVQDGGIFYHARAMGFEFAEQPV